MRVALILDRFEGNAKVWLKDETRRDYGTAFRGFAARSGLEGLTRRQLLGPRGKALLLDELQRTPKPSWRWTLAALKSVWTLGLDLGWPIDPKRDLPPLPRTRRRQSPPDAPVRAWAEAMATERDPYLRLVWLLIAQFGLRPSHVCRLRWRNVRRGEDGAPTAILADGLQEGFKTSSPVAGRLPPDIVEALEAWGREAPGTLPERPLLPRRDSAGRVDPVMPLKTEMLRDHWDRLRRKWRLPVLRPVDVRHWVATACRKSGLSKQASAYLMGHDSAQGGAMRDWYDSPTVEDALAEQVERLPRGPLGLLEPVEVTLADGLPKDAVALVKEYFAGTCGTMEFASRMEAIRLRSPTFRPPAVEP